MKKIKSINAYDLVFCEIDNTYEIYLGEELIDVYFTESEALKNLKRIADINEVNNNQKDD
jgi:hypothetical protein